MLKYHCRKLQITYDKQLNKTNIFSYDQTIDYLSKQCSGFMSALFFIIFDDLSFTERNSVTKNFKNMVCIW